MTRQIGLTLTALAAIALCAVTADTAQARHRRGDGGGSWGGNGGGSWGGNGGSWGGNGGSWGGGGSFGGLFRRHRDNGGSHGGNGNGSHGGGYVKSNGCGSHGGSYSNGHHPEGEVVHEGEVRYYGTREYGSSDNVESAPPAPVEADVDVNSSDPSDDGDRPSINIQQNDSTNAPQTPAPSIEAPQSNAGFQGAGGTGNDGESVRDVTSERPAPPEERLRPQTGEATQ